MISGYDLIDEVKCVPVRRILRCFEETIDIYFRIEL